MKRTILSIAMFLMIASSKQSSAQNSNDVALNLPGLIAAMPLESDKNTREVRLTEVNVRAMRDFSRSYKNVTDARWFNSEKGSFASFASDGKHTKVVYDTRGHRAYAIISYTEGKLDRDVRNLVKSTYYDANIIGVHQFEFSNKTVYAIKMQDQQSNFLTLKVSDGQIEDITSHGKK